MGKLFLFGETKDSAVLIRTNPAAIASAVSPCTTQVRLPNVHFEYADVNEAIDIRLDGSGTDPLPNQPAMPAAASAGISHGDSSQLRFFRLRKDFVRPLPIGGHYRLGVNIVFLESFKSDPSAFCHFAPAPHAGLRHQRGGCDAGRDC